MIVYKIYNSINSKLYIGITTKTIKERWEQHKTKANQGYTTHLYCAMRKYGIDKFHIVQIDTAKSLEELLEKEKYYVSFYDSYCNWYNMTPGGDSNPMDSLEVKVKHDNIMKTSAVREKISKTMKEKAQGGVLFSEEHRKHLSDASFERYGNTEHIKKKQYKRKTSQLGNKPIKPNKLEPIKSEPIKPSKPKLSKSKPIKSKPIKSKPIKPKPIKSKPIKSKPIKPEPIKPSKHDGPTKGRKMIFDLDGNRRYVQEEELEKLLALGWTLPTNKKRGDVPNINTKQRHTYESHMSAEEKHKVLSESHLGISPANKGVPLSKEAREKLSNYYKGTKWVNNGKVQKQVQPDEVQKYLEDGFVLGQLKRRSKRG